MDISIHQLTHIFPGKPPRAALELLDVCIPSGQFTAVVGPSGCGKSTLLRLMAHLLKPTSGQITINGQPPSAMVARRKVAWMAQSPALLPWLTARENIALANKLGNGHNKEKEDRLTPDEALARVGLTDAGDIYPFNLSGGMQQRLALARTLSLEAGIWLMDEPFSALDELTRERLTGELFDLWQPLRPTVVWVTHNLGEALRLSDRVLVLTDRPARLAADFAVPLPHPREEGSPEFLSLLRYLRKALQDG